MRLAPRLVELLELAFGARERLAHRPHEMVDRLLARREIGLRALGLYTERFAREFQERFRVPLELSVRRLTEREAQPVGRNLERLVALGVGGRANSKLRVFVAELATQRRAATEPDEQT